MPWPTTCLAAGMDLVAAVTHPVHLEPGCRALVPTGLVLALPAGLEGQVRPRSGLAWKFGVTVLNSPGTIDADFRGEIKVLLINLGEEVFTVQRGDRIAQLVFGQLTPVRWSIQERLDTTPRGDGGFGHTGWRPQEGEGSDPENQMLR